MRISDWSSDVCSSDLFVVEELLAAVAQCVAAPGVVPQHGNRGRMDRNEPGLAELGVADGQKTCVEIDIVTLNPQHFTDPQSGDSKQAENAIIGPAMQALRRANRQHRIEQADRKSTRLNSSH